MTPFHPTSFCYALARGVRVGVYSPWISHLLFADDSIVFTEASQTGAKRLMEILHIYNRGSGQLVNREKSAVFFSKNCPDEMRSVVCDTLNIHKVVLAERYLGLPTEAGRNLSGLFEFLPAQIRGKIDGCYNRDASCAGREVLLKSVAQAVPTHSMSCFLLPVSTCNKMRSAIANYWWSSSADNRRMHRMKWDNLTKPKKQRWNGLS